MTHAPLPLTGPSDMAQRLAAVEGRIVRAAERAGRPRDSICLVAVSKGQPASALQEAHRLGLRVFGENYAQEAVSKASELATLPDLSWHFIGHLQTNKARLIAPFAHAVHSIDSAHLATELGRRAALCGRTLRAFVEVNVAGEASKTGCAPSELPAILDAIDAQPALALVGLMTMPPWSDDPEEARPHFAALRELRDRMGGSPRLPELSMGMSHDLEVAIQEGATLVRVGTALFGDRPPRPATAPSAKP